MPVLPMIEQVLVPRDPVAGDELGEQRLVETARRLRVEVLDDGVLAQAGELQPGDEPLVLALDRPRDRPGGASRSSKRERGNVGLLAAAPRAPWPCR